MKAYLVLFFSLLITTFLWGKEKATIFFPQGQDSVVIRLTHSPYRELLKTSIILEADTLDCVLDTGCSNLVLDLKYRDKCKVKGSVNAIDSHNEKRNLLQGNISQLRWESVVFQNLKCSFSDLSHIGVDCIIGSDMLQSFFVKIDNETGRLILFKKAPDVNEYDISLGLFVRDNTPYIYLPIIIEGQMEMVEFLVDTGFDSSEEFSLDTVSDTIENAMKWIKTSENTSLFQSKLRIDEVSYFLADIDMINKYFPRVLMSYNSKLFGNLLGISFFYRFSAVVLDFINRKMYFQLPKIPKRKGNTIESKLLDFEKDTVKIASEIHSSFLYDKINTLGLSFRPDSDKIEIESVLKDYRHLVHIGDPLCGVNDILFDEKLISQTDTPDKFKIITDYQKQLSLYASNYYTKNSVRFWFTHKGKLYSLATKRKRMFSNPPQISYGINHKEHKNRMNYYRAILQNIHGFKLSLYYPHRELVNEDVAIEVKHNGKIDTLRN